jgi:hypothetical protein
VDQRDGESGAEPERNSRRCYQRNPKPAAAAGPLILRGSGQADRDRHELTSPALAPGIADAPRPLLSLSISRNGIVD